ncbi:MAG TPA: UDP-N-acetylmuramoyl-tripeptide--D-alanyl-D-alanine ligase [Actinomycetota bacterium]
MRPRALPEVAAAVEGRIVTDADAHASAAGRVSVRGVTIDSRRVEPGELFVALPGNHTDGHAFVAAAAEAGAAAAIVARGRAVQAADGAHRLPLIEVEDPARALMALAADERSGLPATVIGITGSTGKTCTKDFTAAVLATRLRVVASPASFNNEIGLPLTVLSAGPDTEVIVCEMGARGAGHIRALCEVARPSVGVVTNVGVAHLGLFGSREAIADAKAELVEALPADGVAVLFADDAVVAGFAGRTPARTIAFGLGPDAQVRAERVELDPVDGRASFALTTPDGRADVRLPVAGAHMVPDALAAAAVGVAIGVNVADAAAGLEGAELSGGRMDAFVSADGARVIDDAYNANPASVEAALLAARHIAGVGRAVAVLGEMAELGPTSDAEHERVGERVAALGFDELVVVGPQAAAIGDGARRAGMTQDRVHACADVDAAAAVLREVARPDDVILIKASRVARLDRLAHSLRAPSSRARASGGSSNGAPSPAAHGSAAR